MACDVPRTKIYGTLKKLVEKGLVIEIPEDPKKFAPTSPANAFESFLQSFERKTKDLYMAVSFLESTYEEKKAAEKPQREEMWIIRGRNGILQRACEMLSRAVEAVDVVTNENGLILLYKVGNKILDRLVEAGVEVKIATSIGSNNRNIVQELRHLCKIKRVKALPSILFICIDRCEFLLADMNPDDFSPVSHGDVGMFSKNPVSCALISQLFSVQ